MFYEKLAESTAEKQRRKEEDRWQGLRTTGQVGGASLLGNVTAGALMQDFKDEGDVQEVLKRMGAKKVSKSRGYKYKGKGGKVLTPTGGTHALKTKDGRVLGVAVGAPVADHFNPNSRLNDVKRRGDIHLSSGRGTDTFFHELGHATGAGSKRGALLANHGHRLGTDLTGGINAILGLGAATYAGRAKNKEEADHANSVANASLLASAFTHAPTLAEEARASIRARGLAKKFGKGLTSRAHLPLAYGTYLTNAAALSSPAIAAKILAKRKQREFANTEGEASSEARKEKTRRLGAMVRAGTGTTLGAGLAGAYGFSQLDDLKNVARVQGALGKTLLGGAAGFGAGVLYDRYKRGKDAKRS